MASWTHRETLGQSLSQGTCDADPTAVPGLPAGIGSAVLFSGVLYHKVGPDDTDWVRVDVQAGHAVTLNASTGEVSVDATALAGDGMTYSGVAGSEVLDINPDGTTVELSGGQLQTIVGRATNVHGSSNADTTSATHVLIQGGGASEPVTITPGAGTYWAVLTVEANVTAAGESMEISIYGGGVVCACSYLRRKMANVGDIGSMTTQSLVTVGAGEAIEGRFKSVGGNNVRATNRHLTILRVV